LGEGHRHAAGPASDIQNRGTGGQPAACQLLPHRYGAAVESLQKDSQLLPRNLGEIQHCPRAVGAHGIGRLQGRIPHAAPQIALVSNEIRTPFDQEQVCLGGVGKEIDPTVSAPDFEEINCDQGVEQSRQPQYLYTQQASESGCGCGTGGQASEDIQLQARQQRKGWEDAKQLLNSLGLELVFRGVRVHRRRTMKEAGSQMEGGSFGSAPFCGNAVWTATIVDGVYGRPTGCQRVESSQVVIKAPRALRRTVSVGIFGSMIEFEEVAPGVFSVAHDLVKRGRHRQTSRTCHRRQNTPGRSTTRRGGVIEAC